MPKYCALSSFLAFRRTTPPPSKGHAAVASDNQRARCRRWSRSLNAAPPNRITSTRMSIGLRAQYPHRKIVIHGKTKIKNKAKNKDYNTMMTVKCVYLYE